MGKAIGFARAFLRWWMGELAACVPLRIKQRLAHKPQTVVLPYGAVFYIAAAGMIVAGVVTMRVADPVRRTVHAASPDDGLARALRAGLADRVMSMLLLGTLLCALLETQMFSTFSIYMTTKLSLTKADVGLLYGLNGLSVLVLQVPALGLIRRFGIRRVLPQNVRTLLLRLFRAAVQSLWAPLIFAVPVFILALCFAEAASHFSEPGGAYLYARTAFGDFVMSAAGQRASTAGSAVCLPVIRSTLSK